MDQARTTAEPAPGNVIRALFMSSHPQPTLAVTALLSAVAYAGGLSFPRLPVFAAAALAGQLSIGWSNDLIDRRRDRDAGRADKPLARGEVSPRLVGLACVGAVTACVLSSYALGVVAGTIHLLAVAGGWAYNLGLKRTLLSWLPYAVSFGLFTAFATLALPGAPWPRGWAVATGSLLGLGAHFLNVVPDVREDLEAGVRGLPQRLGARRSAMTGAALLAVASVVAVLGPEPDPGPLQWVGLAVALSAASAAGGAGLRGDRTRRPFLLALVTAAVAVALLVAGGGSLT